MLGTSRTFRPAAHAKNRRGIKRHSLRMPGDNYLDTHRYRRYNFLREKLAALQVWEDEVLVAAMRVAA